MATDDPYGVESIMDLLDRERVRSGKPVLHPDVRGKVASDIGGTHDYLNKARLNGALTSGEKSHYMNMGSDKKRDIVSRYASDLADHHAALNNVDMPGDHSHLTDLFTGRKQLPAAPSPVVPTPVVPTPATIPTTHSGPVIPGARRTAAPPVPAAEPVQARLDWMHDELKGLPRTGKGVIAESARQGQIAQLLEPHIADHITTHGEVLSEQKVRNAVRTLAGRTPDELKALSPDELRKVLDPKAPRVKTPAARVQTPLRAGGTAQMDDLIRASSEEIDLAKKAKIQSLHDQGPVPPERLAQVEEAAQTAKLHLRDSIEAHHAPGKFGTAEPPHISNASVRNAASSHFDAVHSGELGRSVPESRLWDNLHADPHAGVSTGRKTVLRQLAIDPATRAVNPQRFAALLSREKALAGTLTEAGAFEQLQALEKKAMLDSHKHFSQLGPLEQQARLQLFDHPHALPDMQRHLVTHHEVERPGFFRRQLQKFKGPQKLGDGMFQHYDGSVSRVMGEEVKMIQHGWDHAGAHSQASTMQALERNRGIMYAASGPMSTGIPSQASIAASRQAAVEAAEQAAVRNAARTEQALVRAAQTVEKKGPGLLRRMVSGVAEHGGGAISTVGKTATGFAGNMAKVALIGGAGIAALGLLSSLSTTRPPRLPAARDSFGDDGVAFNGNPDIGVGAVAMPQIGQQAQMGSWTSRLPSLEETLAMGNTPPPSR